MTSKNGLRFAVEVIENKKVSTFKAYKSRVVWGKQMVFSRSNVFIKRFPLRSHIQIVEKFQNDYYMSATKNTRKWRLVKAILSYIFNLRFPDLKFTFGWEYCKYNIISWLLGGIFLGMIGIVWKWNKCMLILSNLRNQKHCKALTGKEGKNWENWWHPLCLVLHWV